MNFYKRHVGDMAKACGHLSQGQQGAYDLLLDWLYANEKPIPNKPDAYYRIGRARAKFERENVDGVLAEFFTLTDAGFTQKRAGEEMAKAAAQADTNRRIAEEREARKRARIEHESLNESLNGSSTIGQPSQTPDSRLQKEQEQKMSDADKPRRAKSERITFERFIAHCKTTGEKLIPEKHPVFKFAEESGIPVEFVRLAWLEFRRGFGAGGKDARKTQAGALGWRAHFDNCVRRNWFKLWYFHPDGECALTTTGIQLERAAAAEQQREPAPAQESAAAA